MFFNTPEEKETTFITVPPGIYKARVKDSDVKPTNNKLGERAIVMFSIIEGPMKDQTVQGSYNIKHQNEVARNIGRAEFKKMLKACGVEKPLVNESDFHREIAGKVLYIEVENSEYNGKLYANVSKTAPIQGGEPLKAPSAQAPDDLSKDLF